MDLLDEEEDPDPPEMVAAVEAWEENDREIADLRAQLSCYEGGEGEQTQVRQQEDAWDVGGEQRFGEEDRSVGGEGSRLMEEQDLWRARMNNYSQVPMVAIFLCDPHPIPSIDATKTETYGGTGVRGAVPQRRLT